MNEITDARLAAIEARLFKAAEAVVRLADERATHDTVDIICSNADVPVLVREVRLLREQVDSAHRALAVSRTVAGELDAAAMMAVVRDCAWTPRRPGNWRTPCAPPPTSPRGRRRASER